MPKSFRGVVNVDITDDGYPARESPRSFAGGSIVKAVVDVSGAPFVDLATEARAAFARD